MLAGSFRSPGGRSRLHGRTDDPRPLDGVREGLGERLHVPSGEGEGAPSEVPKLHPVIGDAILPLVPINIPEDERGGRSAHYAERQRGETFDVAGRVLWGAGDVEKRHVPFVANIASDDVAMADAAMPGHKVDDLMLRQLAVKFEKAGKPHRRALPQAMRHRVSVGHDMVCPLQI